MEPIFGCSALGDTLSTKVLFTEISELDDNRLPHSPAVTRVSRQMRADFGPSFTVGRNSLKCFWISWKFLDGSTEWDPGYWHIALDPDLVLKIAGNRAGNRAPSAIA